MRHDKATRERLAQDVGMLGVEEACKHHGVHRSTWYRWAHRGEALPFSDPKDGIRDRIHTISREHPAWGCDRIAFFLSFEGVRISSPTVQKHLLGMGIGRRNDRIFAANQDRDRPPNSPSPRCP